MSTKLRNVILPSIFEGDDEPPYKQTELSKEEIADKEKLVLYHFFYIDLYLQHILGQVKFCYFTFRKSGKWDTQRVR